MLTNTVHLTTRTTNEMDMFGFESDHALAVSPLIYGLYTAAWAARYT